MTRKCPKCEEITPEGTTHYIIVFMGKTVACVTLPEGEEPSREQAQDALRLALAENDWFGVDA